MTFKEATWRVDETGLQTKYLYATAEIENTRRRMQQSAEEQARARKRRVLEAFLPVHDNLKRALAHHDSDNPRAGFGATRRGFLLDDGLLRSRQVVAKQN